MNFSLPECGPEKGQTWLFCGWQMGRWEMGSWHLHLAKRVFILPLQFCRHLVTKRLRRCVKLPDQCLSVLFCSLTFSSVLFGFWGFPASLRADVQWTPPCLGMLVALFSELSRILFSCLYLFLFSLALFVFTDLCLGNWDSFWSLSVLFLKHCYRTAQYPRINPELLPL